MKAEKLKAAIRNIPDFPQKGVIFRDITPVLADANLFSLAVQTIAERCEGKEIKAVAAVEARGFIFGAATAIALNVGFIPIRKKGKLPYRTYDESYELEYGSATLSIHVDAVKRGERVLVVDDLLATGGTAAASARLLSRLGAEIVEFVFLIELISFKGREKIAAYPTHSIIAF